MNTNIKLLNLEFERIKNMGWIASKRKGATGIGYTFESLLNKSEENFPIPDFYDIEIKTKNVFSHGKIHLFSATPDGDYLFAIQNLRENFGYPDTKFPTIKKLSGTVNAKSCTPIGTRYLFLLKVNYEKKKLQLIVTDLNYHILNQDTSWSFDLLEEKIYYKLQTLAVVNAYKKTIQGIDYFSYQRISFYRLKDFSTFVHLIETGDIKLSFCMGVYQDGARVGQIHDHGTNFEIQEKDLSKLYYPIHLDKND